MTATIEKVIEEAVEFGLPLEVAEQIAPWLTSYLNDPRGARQALIEEAPAIAEQVGWIRRQ